MKSITRNLFESLNESTSGNTIKEYAMNYLDGYIDNDVTDTEIDMIVAFSFDFNEEPDADFKAYSDFMNLIAERTKIVKVNDSEYGATLVCDFSSVFKPYNEQLKEFFNMENSEFDEDEAWAEAVVNLEALISGNAGDSSYNELISILNSKPMNESVDEDSEPYTVTGIAHVIDWYDSEGTIEMEPYDILEITPENICQGANDNGFGVKEITGIDAYVNGEEYSYSGDEFKKYSQGKEQRGIQIPKANLGEIDNIEYYVLYTLDETYPVIKVNDKFLIARQGTNDFSGQWRLEGFIEANRYNYKWMISPTEALNISDWKYKNGNPKYTVIDYDHGSSRRWGGGGTSHCPYGFSSIDVDGFKRVIGNEDSIKIEDKTYTLKSSVNESDSMLEAQHKTQKAEYTLIPANEPKIKELEGGSAFTWEGLDISSKSLNSIVEFFKENTPSIKLPIEFFTWKGSEMNRIYGLTGDNAYPDDLNFVSIALDNWDGIGALPMIKFQVGARWLDDIVDNNARRQGNLDESADLTAEVTYHDEDGTRDYIAGKLSDGRYFLIGQQEQILVSDKDLPNLAKEDMDDFRYDEDGDKDFIETLENGTTLDKNSDLAKIIINACREYLDDGCYLLSESANIDVNDENSMDTVRDYVKNNPNGGSILFRGFANGKLVYDIRVYPDGDTCHAMIEEYYINDDGEYEAGPKYDLENFDINMSDRDVLDSLNNQLGMELTESIYTTDDGTPAELVADNIMHADSDPRFQTKEQVNDEKLCADLADFALETTDEEYWNKYSDEGYYEKNKRDYMKQINDISFVKGVVDLLETRLRNLDGIDEEYDTESLLAEFKEKLKTLEGVTNENK